MSTTTVPTAANPSQLALPSGQRPRPRNLLNIGVLVVVTGGVALFTTLIAAYVSIGHAAKAWPPGGVTLDVYTGNMLAITALMSAVTVEWASYAVKKGDPAQGTWGLLLTAGFGAGFLLLLWQLGSKIGFGPGSAKIGPFAVVFFAMLASSGAVTLLGIFALLMVLARVLGHQMTDTNSEMLRAVAWYWDFVVVAWLAVFSAVWLFT
jgi:heme/copper-type cytochrome/quinol oxidase subunit 3